MKICIIIDTIRRKSFFLFEEIIFNETNNEIGESLLEICAIVACRIIAWKSGPTISGPSFEFCSALTSLPFLFFSSPFRILPPRFSLRFLLCLPTSILLFYQNGSHDFRLKLNCQRLSLHLFLSFIILRITR